MFKFIILLSVLLTITVDTSSGARRARYNNQAALTRVARQQQPEDGGAAPAGQAEPYSFNYGSTNDDGSTSSRQETSDENGVVKGSYSYQDADGIYRTVEYYADETGFHATVKTNEPGTENRNPADVEINAEPAPAGVVEKWSQASAARGSSGGVLAGPGGARRGTAGTKAQNTLVPKHRASLSG